MTRRCHHIKHPLVFLVLRRELKPVLKKMNRTFKEINMETMIVYVDDAAYARKMLQPLLPTGRTAQPSQSTRWIVVACTPNVTHDISKWVSPAALELWRQDWATAMFDQITPLFKGTGDTLTTQIASHKQSLVDQTEVLTQQHSGAKVLDARRPKFGQDMEPVTATQQQEHNTVSGYAAAVGLASVLAADF
jgi:hypothetical protein